MLRGKNHKGCMEKYSADELEIIFQYYQKCLIEINRVTKYPPTKRNFCAFAGISTLQYDNWLMSADENRAEIMKMIDDYISDVMLTSAQMKEVDNITTMFRAKSEHGMTEAVAPVVIEHRSEANMDKIKQQIEMLKKGKSLKGTIELTKDDYTVEE